MRPQDHLWCFLCVTLLAGCAAQPGVKTVKETRIPGVVIVEETHIPGVRVVEETPAPILADSSTKEPEADASTVFPGEDEPTVNLAAGDIEVEDLPIEAAPDPQASMKEALAQAMTWTIEGLIQYRSGSIEAAHKSLNDAHFRFLEADLPEPLAERGLNLFQESLPADLQLYDPEGIRLHLDRTDRPDGIELVERALVDRGVRRLLWQLGDPPSGDQYLEGLIAETHQYIQYFQGKRRPFFEATYRLKPKYWPMIQRSFAEKGLPFELGYMAFVESGFDPQARSTANAVGVWQFIKDTGREYGLENPDDFHDVEKSTHAAAAYLFLLNNMLGSRLLSVAAYNCGEGGVRKCLRTIDAPGRRSFWGIRDCLPRETRRYVPQILAAAVIGADPKLFGFDLPGEEEMMDRFDVVEVQEITSVARLAELAGVDVASLRKVNTELDGITTTPGRHFPLYVPKGRGALVIAGLAQEEKRPSVAPLGSSLETGRP